MTHRLHILRLTLQAETPVSISSGDVVNLDIPTKDGKEKIATDVMALMRDANNLPTVPGASAQGALRRLYEIEHGEDKTNTDLGCEGPDDKGNTGRISFSWGMVHGQGDAAITGLEGLHGTNDIFLAQLLKDAPLRRDHVALNAHHSVDDHKKFARAAVPVGARFSFELTAWGNDQTRKTLLGVARFSRHPQFRLGGASGRGYGRVKVVRASYDAPDLNNPKALRKLRGQPPSEALCDIMDDPDFAVPTSDATRATATLTFVNGVRIGGATPPAGTVENDKFETLWALREAQFDTASGEIKTSYPLPGSAFRGPLAHRMAYYANKAGGNALGKDKIEELLELSAEVRDARLKEMGDRPELLREFLGHTKTKRGSADKGLAAKLSIDDTVLTVSNAQAVEGEIIQHTSIDRFTGGVRDLTGVLFSEELLTRPTAKIELTIAKPKNSSVGGIGGWDQMVTDCFLKALRDICQGRLPIGARSLGICAGTITWSGAESEAWEAAYDDLISPMEDSA
jgi:CRISPR/Cas system CSM-associated protein Csm3 (group 7 of RAMP superfamily)